MKYLRKFETEADVNVSIVPNVVLVSDTGKILYNSFKGVRIQHIDGTLYTADEWTAGGFTNDQANGVAVGNGVTKFVIAKENISDSMIWSSSSETIGGLTGDAKTDYDGMKHTALIIEKDPLAVAAPECAKYTFPNGKKGYLPAMGELHIARAYSVSINAALSIIGGVGFVDNAYYWSSNESYMNGSAVLRKWADFNFEYTGVKSSTRCVRPFTTF